MTRIALAFAASLAFICVALAAQPWRYMPAAVGDGYGYAEAMTIAPGADSGARSGLDY
jgi:hypothetical protein